MVNAKVMVFLIRRKRKRQIFFRFFVNPVFVREGLQSERATLLSQFAKKPGSCARETGVPRGTHNVIIS